MAERLPLLLEPAALLARLGEDDLLLLDLCKETGYRQRHIPGAIHLAYDRIVAADPPTHGLLPDPSRLEAVFSECGIGDATWVIAYDDEGGGNASRLLWTLEAMGHERGSLLDGGLIAWVNEGHPVSRDAAEVQPAAFHARPKLSPVASLDHIQARLGADDLVLWDARSRNEYLGRSNFARHPGHIPGAVHLEWLEVMDRTRNLRLKPEPVLREMLSGLGIVPEKEVIAYCQTHHRSSLAWFVLKYLGYARARGYPGSWSDWGNRDETPKATS